MQHRAVDPDVRLVEILAEQYERIRAEHDQLRADLERMIAAKPLPPFVPPPVWAEGRHSAGAVVRHHNGLFCSRRDTADEPPGDAWLPLLVGIAGVDFRWSDDRTMSLRVMLSDGTLVETEREFVVPIARGFWKADATYREGDRVLRFGDWQALKESTGIDPNTAANDGYWHKVSGKQARAVSFRLDDDGTMYENDHAIGSINKVVKTTIDSLFKGLI